MKRIWMFWWKFMPLHKWHLYCIDVASHECDLLYVILFANWSGEEKILKLDPWDKMLSVESRFACLKEVCNHYDNVIPIIIDVSRCRNPDWTENWDAETPLVREYIPRMTYVYSSEECYSEYFAHAYPEAEHHIVDAKRKKYPISGTLIRAMKTLDEKKEWMVWYNKNK